MKNMFANLCTMALMMLVGTSCSAQVTEVLTPNAFDEKIKNETNDFVVLDVRTDGEVADGMIPGAIQLDFSADDFEEKLGQLDKSKTYYVYCRSGGRSGKTVAKMTQDGFTTVYDLKGGIIAWQEAGLEIE